MTETVLWDADTKDANWISELQRAKGRIPDPDEPPTTGAPTAASLTPAEMAYSPGQKRDSVGRFGSGGGSAGSSGSSGGGTAGESMEGTDNRRTLQDDIDRQVKDGEERDPGWTRGDVVEGISVHLKEQAMKAVGADLDAQFTAEQLEAAYQPFRRESSGRNGDTPGERVADAMLGTFAQGAYSLEKPSTVALQIAYGREFKTGVGAHIQKDFDEAGQKTDEWAKSLGYDMPVMQAGVRSMYKHTQARLDELGVKGDITLHRGVGRSDIRGEASVDFNAASSWSVDKTTADSFAQAQASQNWQAKSIGGHVPSDSGNLSTNTGTRLTMTVPRERVLSMPGHGIGCFEEGEVVVLRANGDKAKGEEPGYYPGEAIEP